MSSPRPTDRPTDPLPRPLSLSVPTDGGRSDLLALVSVGPSACLCVRAGLLILLNASCPAYFAWIGTWDSAEAAGEREREGGKQIRVGLSSLLPSVRSLPFIWFRRQQAREKRKRRRRVLGPGAASSSLFCIVVGIVVVRILGGFGPWAAGSLPLSFC